MNENVKTMKTPKIFITSDIKRLESQVAVGAISYSKMVQTLNEAAAAYFELHYPSPKQQDASGQCVKKCNEYPNCKPCGDMLSTPPQSARSAEELIRNEYGSYKGSNNYIQITYDGLIELFSQLHPTQESKTFETQNHFYQIVEQSDEEKMAMYMKLPKEEIISMLIQCNKVINGYAPMPQESKEVTDEELETIIDEEIVRMGYDCTGDNTSDFTDGFEKGFRYYEKLTTK